MHSTPVEQQALFDDEESGPPGLRYEPDFIDAAEEQDLLDAIRALPFREAEYRGYTAKRRIVSYGAGYDFDANVLRPAPALPALFHPLRARVAQCLGMEAEVLTHALVTEYRPGTQLGWHRDVPDFATVMGISLGTACSMRFRPYPPQRGQRKFTLELAPRSMYVLAGVVRWQWQHGVPPTPGLRYSITFRTLGPGARKPT
ncbi:MAG: alpha-ketoglutarate-dependent dioxygenase AlkB [Burkholderiaceae bacterium]